MEGFIAIPETNGKYMINQCGEIMRAQSGKILKYSSGSSGYRQIVLRIDGKSVGFLVHRLVAKLFIPNPNNTRVVNHINGNKTDNAISNLEWCTHSENSIHANRTGLTLPPPTWTGRFGAEHNRSVPIHSYNKTGDLLQAYEGINDASRKLNVLASTIWHAIKEGAFCRSAKCFFFYEEQSKEQVIQAMEVIKQKYANKKKTNLRTIYAHDVDGRVIGEYIGMSNAANAHNMSIHNVMDCLRFKRISKKTGIGFTYKQL